MPEKIKKAKIIYDRLYKEYGNYSSLEEFMAELGLDRQSYYYRTKQDDIHYGELIEAFPKINQEWLYSTNLRALRTLPVKTPTFKRDNVTDLLDQLRSSIKNEGVSYESLDALLEYLQDWSGSLSQDLFEISLLMKKIRSDMENQSDS